MIARDFIAAIAVVITASSCSEGATGPVRPLNAEDVTLKFCIADTPDWFAYKNDGYDWVGARVLIPFAVTFPATPKLAIAIHPRAVGTRNTLSVFYLSVDELKA